MTLMANPGQLYQQNAQGGGAYTQQRGPEFAQGATSNPGQPGTMPQPGASLMQSAMKQNMQTPRTWAAHSVLQQIMPSGNGMSQTDAGRMLMGSTNTNKIMNPTMNGQGNTSYQNANMLRLMGNNDSYQ